MDELCELGEGETFGATPVASRAAIGTVGDRRDCPDLTHNPEVVGSNRDTKGFGARSGVRACFAGQ